jgi:hypothetical protein
VRAQTSLPALGFALVLLTGVLVFGVAIADGSLLDADRHALERQAAIDLSDRLLSPTSPLTERDTVVNDSLLASLDAGQLRTRFGLTADTAVAITLDDTTLVSNGSVDSGVSITRLVAVANTSVRTVRPSFRSQNAVTLPRRTDRATVRVRPRPNATVTTVRANERVVLHNDSGLRGTFDISLSPYRMAQLTFEASTRLSADSVTITYYPTTTERARLEVTVDA